VIDCFRAVIGAPFVQLLFAILIVTMFVASILDS